MKRRPQVDYKVCMSCGMCATVCPVSCLTLTRIGKDTFNNPYPEVLRKAKNACIGCGMCAKACPLDALTMRIVA